MSFFFTAKGFSRLVYCSTFAKTLIRDFRKTTLPQRFQRLLKERLRAKDEVLCGWDLAECGWDQAEGGRDLTELLEHLAVNAQGAKVLGSIPESSDRVESEGRQMKQCWMKRKIQKIPLLEVLEVRKKLQYSGHHFWAGGGGGGGFGGYIQIKQLFFKFKFKAF
jgi:hypothetical protein